MTREELKAHCEKQIEMCEFWARLKEEEPHGKIYEEHKLILELLEQEPRWIPVSERLPEVAGCYAVIKKIGSDLIVCACYFDGINTWHNDNWINHERNYLTNIVFWQPLPKPYKAESEVQE